VLREDWSVESVTPCVERWLDDLPDGRWSEANDHPTAILTVAGQARRTTSRGSAGEVAFARVLSRSGRWVFLHGASMVSAGPGRVAVIVEPAHPARIVPLLIAAYGMSEREQEVTRLVLQGASTSEIAEQLVLSPHTVQDHLKRIFEKTGVRSRRDLIGKVFFSFYEPRVRDNEARAQHAQAARGGPLARGG
jgi:DNA-binding CsgD family transcriptional regulator